MKRQLGTRFWIEASLAIASGLLFILTLITGTIIGSYSSYFIATPLVIWWRQRTS